MKENLSVVKWNRLISIRKIKNILIIHNTIRTALLQLCNTELY